MFNVIVEEPRMNGISCKILFLRETDEQYRFFEQVNIAIAN